MKTWLKYAAAFVLTASVTALAAVTVSVNGTNYSIPQTNEKGWGNAVTSWIQAISSNTLQPNTGTFTLTADLDFGASFGLKSLYYKSRSSNLSTAGILRLSNTDGIGWRDSGNTGNYLLLPSATDGLLQYNSINLANISTAQTLTNKSIDADANTITNIDNADIKAGADIARTKVASGTASHVIINDGSGVLSSEASLAISRGGTGQATQTAAFDALAPTTTNGDIIYHNGSDNVRLAAGTDTHVLTLSSGAPTWAAAATSPESAKAIENCSVAASVAANALTLALKDVAGSDPSVGSPCKIGFSNSAAVAGGFTYRTVSAANSVVISSGSTLGQNSNVAATVYVYAFDDSGTIRLGASTQNFGDAIVRSSTAEGGAGAADSAAIIYTGTAVTSKPLRVLAQFSSTQTTAGTWAAALTNYIFNPPYTGPVYANCTGGTGTITGAASTTQWVTCTDLSAVTVSAGVFSITVPGLYKISYSVDVACTSANAGDLIQAGIQKNGSGELNYTNVRWYTAGGATSLNATTVNSLARLVPGDNIRGRILSGCTTPTYTADTSDFMQIVKVAD